MILSRTVWGSLFSTHQRRMSEQGLPYHRRTVPVEVMARSSSTADLKRPPYLLVKSFCNLRRMDYGEDESRVTDELSFQPHRTIFIEILQLPHQQPLGTDSYAEMMPRETALPDPVQVPDSKS